MTTKEKMKKFFKDNQDLLEVLGLCAVSIGGSIVALKALNQNADTIAALVQGIQDKDVSAVTSRTYDDGGLQIKVSHKNGSYSTWELDPPAK